MIRYRQTKDEIFARSRDGQFLCAECEKAAAEDIICGGCLLMIHFDCKWRVEPSRHGQCSSCFYGDD